MEGTPQFEIENAAYNEFQRLWDQGAFEQQRLGQAFYNHFHLHRLTDQTHLHGLYEADNGKARDAIFRLFQFK